MRQKYGRHLRRAHPTEEFNDMSPKQQKSMKEWYGSSICNKAASDANETESITENAQDILF